MGGNGKVKNFPEIKVASFGLPGVAATALNMLHCKKPIEKRHPSPRPDVLKKRLEQWSKSW